MKKILTCIAFSILAGAAAVAQKDPFVGFYLGKVTNVKSYPFGWGSPDLCLEVARYGDTYQLKLGEQPLLRTDTYGFAKGLKAENGKISVKDFSELKLSGEILPDGKVLLKGKNRKGEETVAKLQKTTIQSPTLGMEAPEDAVVLFDGKNTSAWQHANGEKCCWQIVDGAMVSQKLVKDGKRRDGTIFTKRKFGAMKVHLEFMLPTDYKNSETRGNSGVHFGPYEVQIIDSFGSEGNWWQCGSIYRMHAPKSNATLEPGVWQTYDIEFHPAKFKDGKLITHPEMTVYHNGVRVQYKEPVYHPTNITQKFIPHKDAPVPLGLQDHGSPVSFRNVWVQPLK